MKIRPSLAALTLVVGLSGFARAQDGLPVDLPKKESLFRLPDTLPARVEEWPIELQAELAIYKAEHPKSLRPDPVDVMREIWKQRVADLKKAGLDGKLADANPRTCDDVARWPVDERLSYLSHLQTLLANGWTEEQAKQLAIKAVREELAREARLEKLLGFADPHGPRRETPLERAIALKLAERYAALDGVTEAEAARHALEEMRTRYEQRSHLDWPHFEWPKLGPLFSLWDWVKLGVGMAFDVANRPAGMTPGITGKFPTDKK